jgi:hypothetical protein
VLAWQTSHEYKKPDAKSDHRVWWPFGRLSGSQPSAWIWAWSWGPLRFARRHPPHHLSPTWQITRQGGTPKPALGRPGRPQQRSIPARKPVSSEQDRCFQKADNVILVLSAVTGARSDRRIAVSVVTTQVALVLQAVTLLVCLVVTLQRQRKGKGQGRSDKTSCVRAGQARRGIGPLKWRASSLGPFPEKR